MRQAWQLLHGMVMSRGKEQVRAVGWRGFQGLGSLDGGQVRLSALAANNWGH